MGAAASWHTVVLQVLHGLLKDQVPATATVMLVIGGLLSVGLVGLPKSRADKLLRKEERWASLAPSMAWSAASWPHILLNPAFHLLPPRVPGTCGLRPYSEKNAQIQTVFCQRNLFLTLNTSLERGSRERSQTTEDLGSRESKLRC